MRGVQTDIARVARTYEALQELAAVGRPPSLVELSAAAGTPRSTIALDLKRLAAAGMVRKLPGPRGAIPVKGGAVE